VADSALATYRRLVSAQVRSQAQYRASFFVEIAGSVLLGALDLIGVLILFRVSRTVGGFDFRAVFLMAALAGCAFALADLAADVAPKRAGRVLFTVGMVALAAHHARVGWTPARLALVVVTPLAGAVLFGAIFVAGATVAFWWIDSGEFANAVTYGGRDFTSYPMTAYGGLFRRLLSYGMGFAFVGYYPALALLGRRDPLGLPAAAGWLGPVVALVAAAVAAGLWKRAIRHYRSTGS
jgi:ABC-2 type transport system permease protein